MAGKIGYKLLKLGAMRPPWLELMLDPLSEFCYTAESINETLLYCTALPSVQDAYIFPLMISKASPNYWSERMVKN